MSASSAVHPPSQSEAPAAPRPTSTAPFTVVERDFPLFGRLPKELRDAVWDMAAQAERPGFHYFQEASWSSIASNMCNVPGPVPPPVHAHAAPLCDQDVVVGFSWTGVYWSAYLRQEGLAMACREGP